MMEHISHIEADCKAVTPRPWTLRRESWHERCPNCGAWACSITGAHSGRDFCCNYCETLFSVKVER